MVSLVHKSVHKAIRFGLSVSSYGMQHPDDIRFVGKPARYQFIESSHDPVRRISRFFNRSCEFKQTMAPKKSNLLAYVEMPVVPVSNS